MTATDQHRLPADVIVVSWNHRDLLLECLRHIEASSVEHELIVVDNGSTDGSVEAVNSTYPHTKIVALDENVGYGPAFNRGIEAGSAELLFFINNDANIAPDFLEKLSVPFDDPSVGMVGGVSVNPVTGAVDAAGLQLDRGVGGYLYRTGERLERVDTCDPTLIGPAFAAVALRRSAFEQVGGFDPEIFAYCEEVDLVIRMRNVGWRFAIVDKARAEHIGSATLGSRTLAQMRHAARSRGYVAGVYRISFPWLVTELVVGAVDSLRLRSPVPLAERVRGWREGRRLPRRRPPEDVVYLSWLEAMRLRLRAM